MKYRSILALAAVPLIFTGCMQSNEPELTPEEQEHNALVEWFETGMANEDKFPDLPDYRYYARTDLFSLKCGRSSITKTST